MSLRHVFITYKCPQKFIYYSFRRLGQGPNGFPASEFLGIYEKQRNRPIIGIALGLNQCHTLNPPTATHSEPGSSKGESNMGFHPPTLCIPSELLLYHCDHWQHSQIIFALKIPYFKLQIVMNIFTFYLRTKVIVQYYFTLK